MLIYFHIDPDETLGSVVVKNYPALTSIAGSPFSGVSIVDLLLGQYSVNVGAVTGNWKLFVFNSDGDEISYCYATSTRLDVDGNTTALDVPSWLIPSPIILSPPVMSIDGQLNDAIIIDADYLAFNGRAFEWTVAAPAGAILAESTAQLGFFHSTKGSLWLQGIITDAGSGYWDLSFDIRASDTAGIEPGEYEWTVQITDQYGHRIPVVRNSDGRCQTVKFVANRAPQEDAVTGYHWDGGTW